MLTRIKQRPFAFAAIIFATILLFASWAVAWQSGIAAVIVAVVGTVSGLACAYFLAKKLGMNPGGIR